MRLGDRALLLSLGRFGDRNRAAYTRLIHVNVNINIHMYSYLTASFSTHMIFTMLKLIA